MIKLVNLKKYDANKFIKTFLLRDITLDLKQGVTIVQVMHDEQKPRIPARLSIRWRDESQ